MNSSDDDPRQSKLLLSNCTMAKDAGQREGNTDPLEEKPSQGENAPLVDSGDSGFVSCFILLSGILAHPSF
jgi:hypothetical protein